jgi:putative multiple sugar transport system substrate-binding protein
MRALCSLIAAAVLVVGISACAPTAPKTPVGDGRIVGVALPTNATDRWIKDGDTIKAQLERAGYTVDLEYAADDIPTQVNQVSNMISKGAKVLIIAAIDGAALTEVLETAGKAQIPVIAYDRFIRDSAYIDYYLTFDEFFVGQQQAWSVMNGLGLTERDGTALADASAGPFTVELFAGSINDDNAYFHFDGAMSVLQPMIDSGTLIVRSGETKIDQTATVRSDGTAAKKRMVDILSRDYPRGTKIDAILSPSDGISRGIVSALQGAGYSLETNWPIISGQDPDADSVKAILSGEQYASVYKDTAQLAKVAAKMAVTVLQGSKPEINDTTTYDNGKKLVPSFLVKPVVVVKSNVTSTVVDSGYVTKPSMAL